MTDSKAVDNIKQLLERLNTKLKPPIPKKTKAKLTFKNPQSFAFQLLREKADCALPLFEGLDTSLQHSGLKINFKAYLSLTMLMSTLVSVGSFAVVPCLTFAVFGVPLLASIMFGIGGGLFAFAISIIGFYAYPLYRADKLKRELDDELLFTSGYMAILTSAGVSPEKIFYSISNLTVPLAVSGEAKDIVRDISLFGRDIISALEEESKRTPSERFREMLEGFISTIHSGGNLAAYLREKSRQYMKLKRISLHKFSDTLAMLSEFYVAILVTGPLMLVIMLAVMAMLGGGTSGLLDPGLSLNLLTYIGIPLGSIMFLIILDVVSPKW